MELHSFENKLSKQNKESNWKVLRKYFAKNNFLVDEELIQKVICCDDGAAEQFLFLLYTALTRREIQLIPPSYEPEVDHVPVFVKSHHVQQQNTQQHSRSKADESSEQEEQRLAEERARLEAQRRAEAQQRQQHSKPKTLAKAHAIQSPGEDNEHDGSMHHAVQFSSVTVKPLPPQMLARFGNRGAAAGGDGGKGGRAGLTGGSSEEDAQGVTSTISTLLLKILDDAGLPVWPTSSSMPTAADFFFKNVSSVEPSIRSVMWSQLLASTGMVAAVLIRRPSEFSSFVELVQPHIRTRAPPQGGNGALVAKYFSSVISIVSSSNPAVALSGLREAFLPMVVSCCPLTAALADWFGHLLLSFVHVVGGSTPVFASAFFSSIYDELSSPRHTDDASSASARSSGTRSDFLLVLHSILDGFVARKRSGIDDDGAAATCSIRLNEQCAAVAYYNAVAGLHSEAPKDRVTAMRLLSRLVRLGAADMIIHNRHLAEFTAALTTLSRPRPAWAQSCDALVAYAQLAESLLERQLSAQGGDSDAHDVLEAVAAMRTLALNDASILPSVARQYMVAVLSKATALFPPSPAPQKDSFTGGDDSKDTASPLAVELAAYLVRSPFVRDNVAALIGNPSADDVQPSAEGQPGQEGAPLFRAGARTTIAESNLLGTVAIPTVLRSACPLRLALGLLQATPMPVKAAAAVEAVGGGAAHSTNSKKGGASSASSHSSVAKVASRILKNGDLSELATDRLQWIHALFAAHQDAALASRTLGQVADEDLVTHWWAVVKQLEPNLGVVLYAAELLASQQQQHASSAKAPPHPTPSEETVAAVYNAAGIAQSLLVRCYIDFSGHILPAPSSFGEYLELRHDPTLTTRAMEWFQHVVVESS